MTDLRVFRQDGKWDQLIRHSVSFEPIVTGRFFADCRYEETQTKMGGRFPCTVVGKSGEPVLNLAQDGSDNHVLFHPYKTGQTVTWADERPYSRMFVGAPEPRLPLRVIAAWARRQAQDRRGLINSNNWPSLQQHDWAVTGTQRCTRFEDIIRSDGPRHSRTTSVASRAVSSIGSPLSPAMSSPALSALMTETRQRAESRTSNVTMVSQETGSLCSDISMLSLDHTPRPPSDAAPVRANPYIRFRKPVVNGLVTVTHSHGLFLSEENIEKGRRAVFSEKSHGAAGDIMYKQAGEQLMLPYMVKRQCFLLPSSNTWVSTIPSGMMSMARIDAMVKEAKRPKETRVSDWPARDERAEQRDRCREE